MYKTSSALVLNVNHTISASVYFQYNLLRTKQLRPLKLSNSMLFPFLLLLGLVRIAQAVNSHTMQCQPYDQGGAPASCQNQCWYANCYRRQEGNQYSCDKEKANAIARRAAAGCNKLPCTKLADRKPFSDYVANGNVGDGIYQTKPSCDEFPAATFNQGGRGSRLRCIDQRDNSSKHIHHSMIYPQLIHPDSGAGKWYDIMCDQQGTNVPFGITQRNRSWLYVFLLLLSETSR